MPRHRELSDCCNATVAGSIDDRLGTESGVPISNRSMLNGLGQILRSHVGSSCPKRAWQRTGNIGARARKETIAAPRFATLAGPEGPSTSIASIARLDLRKRATLLTSVVGLPMVTENLDPTRQRVACIVAERRPIAREQSVSASGIT